MVDDAGMVTEGSSTNAWIVTREGQLVTRPTGNEILSGITRGSVMDLMRREGIDFVQRPFTVEEAKQARAAIITSATSSDRKSVVTGKSASGGVDLGARRVITQKTRA